MPYVTETQVTGWTPTGGVPALGNRHPSLIGSQSFGDAYVYVEPNFDEPLLGWDCGPEVAVSEYYNWNEGRPPTNPGDMEYRIGLPGFWHSYNRYLAYRREILDGGPNLTDTLVWDEENGWHFVEDGVHRTIWNHLDIQCPYLKEHDTAWRDQFGSSLAYNTDVSDSKGWWGLEEFIYIFPEGVFPYVGPPYASSAAYLHLYRVYPRHDPKRMESDRNSDHIEELRRRSLWWAELLYWAWTWDYNNGFIYTRGGMEVAQGFPTEPPPGVRLDWCHPDFHWSSAPTGKKVKWFPACTDSAPSWAPWCYLGQAIRPICPYTGHRNVIRILPCPRSLDYPHYDGLFPAGGRMLEFDIMLNQRWSAPQYDGNNQMIVPAYRHYRFQCPTPADPIYIEYGRREDYP